VPAAFDPAEVPDLAPLIDHALLQPRLGSESIERGCEQALHYGFAGICLASRWMLQARQWLGERSSVRLISVLSFPFGACSSAIKRAEAEAAVEAGADELDLVPDFALLLDGELTALHDQIAAVVELGLPLKLILEADQLSSDQLQTLVEVGLDAGVAFLKTGSGYGQPASSAIVRQLHGLAAGRAKVKASGGIRDLGHAIELVQAGAQRLGTSRGVELVQAQRE
jgi:deoxyribose-phosphate aldolase